MLDIEFSRTEPPSAVQPCVNPCRRGAATDEQVSQAVQRRIESLTGEPVPATGLLPGDETPRRAPADDTPCATQARMLGPALRRFNRYRKALPYARAANDMNQLGDDPATKPPKAPCLTRLPDTGDALCDALELPRGTIKDEYLRDDKTGFRAAMYRDETSDKLILVARDTQPTSLVDWQTNTRNGDGQDTDQYAAMRQIARVLDNQGIDFDVAGYSKGGGLAQEAALVNKQAKAFVFNAAGLHPNSLARTGNTDFLSLQTRTSAFSAEGDFLTYMNTTTDSDQQIANVRFLRSELAGQNRWLVNPMKIDHRSPILPDAGKDKEFQESLSDYMSELDAKISSMVADRQASQPLAAFPPVRATQQEVIPGSMSAFGQFLGARSKEPNLGKLAQHQMSNVLEPMTKNVENDREALCKFITSCGL
jgi:hypothetical protein